MSTTAAIALNAPLPHHAIQTGAFASVTGVGDDTQTFGTYSTELNNSRIGNTTVVGRQGTTAKVLHEITCSFFFPTNPALAFIFSRVFQSDGTSPVTSLETIMGMYINIPAHRQLAGSIVYNLPPGTYQFQLSAWESFTVGMNFTAYNRFTNTITEL